MNTIKNSKTLMFGKILLLYLGKSIKNFKIAKIIALKIKYKEQLSQYLQILLKDLKEILIKIQQSFSL